ncbi:AAA ATPase domain-containing protein [Rhizobium sp. TAL182]|uniref:AAA family ATPase n=1 Tax=Rhizobium sp. TAL182 TaxID=2020313 RepID=UPI000A2103CB|nr:DUF3696 domain-containing protein [Rhizobium sp. TAL182]ARO24719.1 AAA ATPase domain-containing protein [Rhizobium sp. TAL182]
MLTHWSLNNFKAFKELPPLNLSMVNVLAGANSSGKSTLIQSILVLKQTLQYGPEDRAISLNGPILRMGSFRDVKNHEAARDDFAINFNIEIKNHELSYQGRPHWSRSSNYGLQMGGPGWEAISLSLQYGLPETDDFREAHVQERNLSPDLISTSLRLLGKHDEEQVFLYCDFLRGGTSSRFPYEIDTDPDTERELIDSKPEGTIEGGYVSYFLPEFAVVKFNQTEVEIDALIDALFRQTSLLATHRVSSEETLSPKIVSAINEWLIAHGAEPFTGGAEPVQLSDAQEKLSRFIRRPAGLLASLRDLDQSDPNLADITRLKAAVKDIASSERKPEFQYMGGRSQGIDYAGSYITDFFKFGIRYLGPLRDSPRPVYQPEALESTTDVGYRGEHTAAVFEINKRNHVAYHSPPDGKSETDYVALSVERLDILEVAAASWLEYLGVATSVETMDAGVFGNRMRVSVGDEVRLHDLTNVGVGVSQVLPIVVMALLAPRGSLLVFEQPELHLHPKVQARLADFFLALALDGKQTILETHSEYLVDRLRLRIATAPSDNVRPLVNILFSEKKGSVSGLTPVEISEFGAILNWPKDFFEQSQQDVGRIIQAAARKRKSKIRND